MVLSVVSVLGVHASIISAVIIILVSDLVLCLV